jgi:hypothetical protein
MREQASDLEYPENAVPPRAVGAGALPFAHAHAGSRSASPIAAPSQVHLVTVPMSPSPLLLSDFVTVNPWVYPFTVSSLKQLWRNF